MRVQGGGHAAYQPMGCQLALGVDPNSASDFCLFGSEWTASRRWTERVNEELRCAWLEWVSERTSDSSVTALFIKPSLPQDNSKQKANMLLSCLWFNVEKLFTHSHGLRKEWIRGSVDLNTAQTRWLCWGALSCQWKRSCCIDNKRLFCMQPLKGSRLAVCLSLSRQQTFNAAVWLRWNDNSPPQIVQHGGSTVEGLAARRVR